MKVLIVSDDEHEAQLVWHLLSSHGHLVHISSLHEHLKHIVVFNPDVLITDIFVHNNSPFQVVNAAREVSKGLRVVALDSAKKHRMPFYADVALSLGADAAIMSPVEPTRLLEAVGA